MTRSVEASGSQSTSASPDIRKGDIWEEMTQRGRRRYVRVTAVRGATKQARIQSAVWNEIRSTWEPTKWSQQRWNKFARFSNRVPGLRLVTRWPVWELK